MLRQAVQRGKHAALTKFGLAQPSLASVGIKAPTTAPGLPSVPGAPTIPKPPSVTTSSMPSVSTAKPT